MFVLGLTGGSGSGKSLLARLLAERGAAVLDADAVYHGITDHPSRCVEELAAAFGSSVLTPEGALDRAKLAPAVFCGGELQRSRLLRLNEITHRYVRAEFERLMHEHREMGCEFLVLDVPLLFEAGMDVLCDATLAVLASREVRIARITERDGIDRIRAEARIDAQPTDGFYTARASVTVRNDGDKAALEAEAERLLEQLLNTGLPEQK